MSDNKQPKNNTPNIGKNTQWDSQFPDPSAGSTLPKPPTSLKPKDNKPKK